ncbi:MAG: hypothetical protein U1B77_04455 [Dehalococcoidales bacterium]|nr:hypothetical protein [Dehalococcoidales bacterium]
MASLAEEDQISQSMLPSLTHGLDVMDLHLLSFSLANETLSSLAQKYLFSECDWNLRPMPWFVPARTTEGWLIHCFMQPLLPAILVTEGSEPADGYDHFHLPALFANSLNAPVKGIRFTFWAILML